MQKYVPLVKQNVMKLEVFILGGQRIDQKRKKGWWRGSRERIEKGSRDRENKDKKELSDQQLKDKELIRRERRDGGEGEERGLRKGAEIERKRTKGIESTIKGQRIDQKRKKGWWRGRRERIEKGGSEMDKRELS